MGHYWQLHLSALEQPKIYPGIAKCTLVEEEEDKNPHSD
jgi:hypothetical protein